MSGRRRQREEGQRRTLLVRALALAEDGGLEAALPGEVARLEGFPLRSLGPDPEDLFYPDETDLRTGFGEILAQAGLLEAALAWAHHLEGEGELWRRRLALQHREPRLRARRGVLDEAWGEMLEAHFLRWGAAGPAGERTSKLEAALVLAALRGAEGLWWQGNGRPRLPVLVQEALALLWPALYAHARKIR